MARRRVNCSVVETVEGSSHFVREAVKSHRKLVTPNRQSPAGRARLTRCLRLILIEAIATGSTVKSGAFIVRSAD